MSSAYPTEFGEWDKLPQSVRDIFAAKGNPSMAELFLSDPMSRNAKFLCKDTESFGWTTFCQNLIDSYWTKYQSLSFDSGDDGNSTYERHTLSVLGLAALNDDVPLVLALLKQGAEQSDALVVSAAWYIDLSGSDYRWSTGGSRSIQADLFTFLFRTVRDVPPYRAKREQHLETAREVLRGVLAMGGEIAERALAKVRSLFEADIKRVEDGEWVPEAETANDQVKPLWFEVLDGDFVRVQVESVYSAVPGFEDLVLRFEAAVASVAREKALVQTLPTVQLAEVPVPQQDTWHNPHLARYVDEKLILVPISSLHVPTGGEGNDEAGHKVPTEASMLPCGSVAWCDRVYHPRPSKHHKHHKGEAEHHKGEPGAKFQEYTFHVRILAHEKLTSVQIDGASTTLRAVGDYAAVLDNELMHLVEPTKGTVKLLKTPGNSSNAVAQFDADTILRGVVFYSLSTGEEVRRIPRVRIWNAQALNYSPKEFSPEKTMLGCAFIGTGLLVGLHNTAKSDSTNAVCSLIVRDLSTGLIQSSYLLRDNVSLNEMGNASRLAAFGNHLICHIHAMSVWEVTLRQ